MNKIKTWLLNIAIAYINWYSKDSKYITKTNREYQYAWPNYKTDEMQSLMCKQVNDLLSILATHEDSGFSIGYKLSLFNKVAMFKPLSKLTFDDNEFGECYDINTQQNKRDSGVFKRGDVYNFVDSFIKDSTFYIGEDNIVISRNRGSWSGGVFVISKDNNSIYYIHNDRIKDITKFTATTYHIPIYELEYPNDWWISFCKEEDLIEYAKEYDFDRDFNKIDSELAFKNGQYKDAILLRIDTIRNHMYSNTNKS